MRLPGEVGPRSFLPEVVVAVKALACEPPSRLGATVAPARAVSLKARPTPNAAPS